MTLFETFMAERVDNGASTSCLYSPTDPAVRPAYETWKAHCRS